MTASLGLMAGQGMLLAAPLGDRWRDALLSEYAGTAMLGRFHPGTGPAASCMTIHRNHKEHWLLSEYAGTAMLGRFHPGTGPAASCMGIHRNHWLREDLLQGIPIESGLSRNLLHQPCSYMLIMRALAEACIQPGLLTCTDRCYQVQSSCVHRCSLMLIGINKFSLPVCIEAMIVETSNWWPMLAEAVCCLLCTAIPLQCSDGSGTVNCMLPLAADRALPLHRCHSGTIQPAFPQLRALPRSAPFAAVRSQVCSDATHPRAHPLMTLGETSLTHLHGRHACIIRVRCLALMPQVIEDSPLLNDGVAQISANITNCVGLMRG